MSLSFIKYKLLLAIEDENSVLIFKSVLEVDYGYSIKIIDSFEGIYNEYKKKKYDIVILTSLGIYATHILEYIVKLKMYDPKIKLIVLSNYDNENFIESLASAGIDTIYQLPIEFDDLHSGIQTLLHPPPIKK
jgi:DNA-binding NarL/FixJ family response regulator